MKIKISFEQFIREAIYKLGINDIQDIHLLLLEFYNCNENRNFDIEFNKSEIFNRHFCIIDGKIEIKDDAFEDILFSKEIMGPNNDKHINELEEYFKKLDVNVFMLKKIDIRGNLETAHLNKIQLNSLDYLKRTSAIKIMENNDCYENVVLTHYGYVCLFMEKYNVEIDYFCKLLRSFGYTVKYLLAFLLKQNLNKSVDDILRVENYELYACDEGIDIVDKDIVPIKFRGLEYDGEGEYTEKSKNMIAKLLSNEYMLSKIKICGLNHLFEFVPFYETQNPNEVINWEQITTQNIGQYVEEVNTNDLMETYEYILKKSSSYLNVKDAENEYATTYIAIVEVIMNGVESYKIRGILKRDIYGVSIGFNPTYCDEFENDEDYKLRKYFDE